MKTFQMMMCLMLAALFAFGCEEEGDAGGGGDDGPLHPPSWIVGTWEGGSPITLHLEFTANNAYDEDGNPEFVGYDEDGATSSEYALSKGKEFSVFKKVSGSTVDWFVSNGTISNTTRMKKQ